MTFVVTSVLVHSRNASGISVLWHVSYFDIIVPYFGGCIFVFVLVLLLFKNRDSDLILSTKPLSRKELSITKVIIFLSHITIFSFFIFVTNSLAGNLDRYHNSKNVVVHASSIAVGGWLVLLSFGSIVILISQIYNVIFYCVCGIFTIFFIPALSLFFSLFSSPHVVETKFLYNYEKVQVVDKNGNLEERNLLINEKPQEKIDLSYSKIAPIDVMYHWRILYGFLQPIDALAISTDNDGYNNSGTGVIPTKSPQIIKPSNNSMLLKVQEGKVLKEYGFMAHSLYYSRWENNQAKDAWNYALDQAVKIFDNKSNLPIDFQNLFKAAMESSELTVKDKMKLVEMFSFLNAPTLTGNNKQIFDYDKTLLSLKNMGINYDEANNTVTVIPKNDPAKAFDANNNENVDFISEKSPYFTALYQIMNLDEKVAQVKEDTLPNNFSEGLYDVNQPVENIYVVKPWVSTKNIAVAWIILPILLLGLSTFAQSYKDIR